MQSGSVYRDFLRFWRASRRSPGYTLTLVLLLGMGIAGSVTMFAVLERALFRPVDLPDLDQIVIVDGAATPPGGDRLAWWGQAKALAALAEYSTGGANLRIAGQAERIRAAMVSASFFQVVDTAPHTGRTFLADEQVPGRNRVALLSHSLATAQFGRAESALGGSVTLNGVPYNVIGVMPRGFAFPARTDIWVPWSPGSGWLDLGSEPDTALPSSWGTLVGRLQPGVSLAEARAELNVLHTRLEQTYSKSGILFGTSVGVAPLRRMLARESRPALLALFAAVLFVLLLTCANTAGLLLARTAARQKEVAVLLCLGANRASVFRQFLIESLFLALGGGTVGVLLAILGVDLFRAYGPADIPGLWDVRMDLRVLAFALAVSLFTAITLGLLPAVQTFLPDISQALREQGQALAGVTGQRLRRWLVVAEVAIGLVLTAGAGLMIGSLRRLISVAPGFDPHNVLTAELALPRARYTPRPEEHSPGHAVPEKKSNSNSQPKAVSQVNPNAPPPSTAMQSANARIAAFQQNLFERIGKLPGITAVGVVSDLPLSNSGHGGFLTFEVHGIISPLAMAAEFQVAGEYFRAMGIPLRVGRFFSEADADAAPRVVIVNDTLARRWWGSKNPVGDYLLIEGEGSPREVVGVVGDVKYEDLAETPSQQFYLPWLQPYSPGRASPVELEMILAMRGASVSSAGAAIRDAVMSLDSDLPLFRVRPMEEVVSDSARSLRFRAILLAGFAVMALALAGAGVYGVLAYSVAHRTHEIGVRMAMGAEPRDVFVLVMGEGARLGFFGVAAGSLASLALNRLIASLLFNVSPTDVATLAASALWLFAIVLVASAFPAARAVSVDPATSLRYE